MSDVKRYRPMIDAGGEHGCESAVMRETKTGDYVHLTDYAALSARLDGMVRERDEAVRTMTSYYDRIQELELALKAAKLLCPDCRGSGRVSTWDMNGGPPLADCPRCGYVRAALRALPPQQETKRGFTRCIFIGDPPAPHISWHDWANADNYCDVTIMANKALPPTDGTEGAIRTASKGDV